jgi:hypothetical protein
MTIGDGNNPSFLRRYAASLLGTRLGSVGRAPDCESPSSAATEDRGLVRDSYSVSARTVARLFGTEPEAVTRLGSRITHNARSLIRRDR